jgi:hypothetical protein
MDIKKINTTTNRVSDKNIKNSFQAAPTSPNCGLSCYLAEAFIKAEITPDTRDKLTEEAIISLLDESQTYARFDNKLFWGWEKNPTINEVKFPFDWDDTAKALDLLYIAKDHNKSGYIDFKELPDKDDLNELFKESLFKRKKIGENKAKQIKCPYHTSLFVFFGSGSEKMEKRDDPMVTVATIRMLAKWYPEVVKKNKRKVKTLIKRAIYTLNYLIVNKNEKFEDFSRYYFSLGHFAYRLFETIDYLDKIDIKIHFNPFKLLFKSKLLRQTLNFERIKLQVEVSYKKINNHSNNNDCYWWYLLGLKLELITVQHNFEDKILKRCNDRLVYQHRRLNHQYFSEEWEKKLLYCELEKHNITIHKNNIDNFNGLRFLKKTTVPIFAIAAFIVFILSFMMNNDNIIKNIIVNTNVFKSLIDNPTTVDPAIIVQETRKFFPYISLVLNSIFIIIGIRLYLQAWAVEETYLTNRIKAPIKNILWRNTMSGLDNVIRFIWTSLVMIFPIYFNLTAKPFELTWHVYLFYIYLSIFIWDLVIYFDYKKLYKNLGKNIKSVNIYWIGLDFVLLTLAAISTITLNDADLNLRGWLSGVFLIIWAGLMTLSLIQIIVFSMTIFSNKISYKYDS